MPDLDQIEPKALWIIGVWLIVGAIMLGLFFNAPLCASIPVSIGAGGIGALITGGILDAN